MEGQSIFQINTVQITVHFAKQIIRLKLIRSNNLKYRNKWLSTLNIINLIVKFIDI